MELTFSNKRYPKRVSVQKESNTCGTHSSRLSDSNPIHCLRAVLQFLQTVHSVSFRSDLIDFLHPVEKLALSPLAVHIDKSLFHINLCCFDFYCESVVAPDSP